MGVSIVIENNGLFLLGDRADAKDRDVWEFPSGKLNSGENAYEAAVREGREELGVEIKPQRIISTYFFRAYDTDNLMINYYCTASELPLSSTEHTELRWVDKETAISLLPYDVQRQILDQIDFILRLPRNVGMRLRL